MDNEKRIKQIQKEFMILGIVDAVPMIMIGLCMSAKFGKGSEPIFSILKNDLIVNGMLAVSVPVVLWVIYKAVRLSLERKQLKNSINL